MGREAIVIGCGVGGMFQAAALAKHFDQVTVVDSDVIDLTRPSHRRGAAQDLQLHALLLRGNRVFERFLPGLTQQLLDAGARQAEFGPRLLWHTAGTWWSTRPTGIQAIAFTRPLFEFHLRKRLLAEKNVRLVMGARARDLVWDEQTSRVEGVCVEHLDTSRIESLKADLVVDCSGRNSKAPEWLASAGLGTPAVEEVDIGVTYTTMRVRYDRPPPWNAVYVAPSGPESRRSGIIMGAENNEYVVTMGAYQGERPEPSFEGTRAFARKLPQPAIAQALADAVEVEPPTPYHFKSNLRRYYGKMKRFPDGFIVSGDSVCSFNPLYGQGMTVAAIAAELLDRCLRRPSTGSGFSLRYQRQLEKAVEVPWIAALANDLRYPDVKGPRSLLLRFMGWYSSSVLKSMHLPAVHRRFLLVMNMVTHPLALFHPILAGAALLQGLGLIRPSEQLPGALMPGALAEQR